MKTMASEPASIEKLHDIILPAIESGLPAPGWWILTVILLLIAIALITLVLRYHLNGKAQREANRYLQDLTTLESESNKVITANTLLKRCALAYYPRQQVAALNGKEWWLFLDSQLPKNERQFVHQQARWEQALYGDNTESELDFVKLSQRWLKLGLRKTRLRSACGLKSPVYPLPKAEHQA
ncbi:DUF4381 domain-containing protein [Alginatibacterium sediminis]|uniref:DUF4381 domain-containing protein n=1 Tax=Alginatibacterium sediminis TaxID=2164068 RepID=A0A420EG39_9ALTE|nr:DUF4381 domain-containing protein [Alginatibacterium sediminis]RKF19672.1 DUF4381 domain-containing protein [Alginatibacterium sediminis]